MSKPRIAKPRIARENCKRQNFVGNLFLGSFGHTYAYTCKVNQVPHFVQFAASQMPCPQKCFTSCLRVQMLKKSTQGTFAFKGIRVPLHKSSGCFLFILLRQYRNETGPKGVFNEKKSKEKARTETVLPLSEI